MKTNENLYRFLMVLSTTAAIALFFAIKFEGYYPEILRPLDMFKTWIHECGHTFAVLANGGQVFKIVVNSASNGGGYMTGAGGNPIIVAVAGMGTTVLMGTTIIFFTSRFQWGAASFFVWLIPCIFVTLKYGSPDDSGIYTSTLVMLFFTVLIFFVSLKTNWIVGNSLVHFLGVFLALDGVNAFWSLGYLSRPDHNNDIESLSHHLPLLSGNAWGFVLGTVSLAFIGVALYYSILKPVKVPEKFSK